MTTQQKDVLVNKIMIYITAAFGGTILWYVMFSLMQSSLIIRGYYISLILAALFIICGFIILFHKGFRKKTSNASSYARMSFIIALLLIILWTPYVMRSLGLYHVISGISLLSNIISCAHFTLLLSYIVLAVAIVVNIIAGCCKSGESNPVHVEASKSSNKKNNRK